MVFHEWRHFLRLSAEKFIKTQKHASFFEKFQLFAKSIIFHGFSRNEALFASFCRKLDENAKTCQFVQEMSSFGQIDDFSWFFAKEGTFCDFLLKSSSKHKNMPVCSKTCKFWPNRWFFMLFQEMRHFLKLLANKLIKTQKHGNFFKKIASFGQIDDFSWLFTKWGTFCKFLLKSWSKRKNMPVCSKNVKVCPNWWFFMVFHEMRNFLRLFSEKFIKREKHASSVKKLTVLVKSMIFHAFLGNEALFATFSWKLDQNAKTWQFVPKVSTFGQIDDFW